MLRYYLNIFSGENYKTDNYVVTPKTMDILKEHLDKFGNQVSKIFGSLGYASINFICFALFLSAKILQFTTW